MTRPRLVAASIVAVATVLAVVACGGGGGSPTGPGGGMMTANLSGTTRGSSSSCAGFSFSFVAGEGPITVTLTQSSGEAPLSAQVCAGAIDNRDCSINQAPIAVGQTLTGQRRGIASQTLVIQPCGGGGTFPETTVTFAATLTYLGP